jgi:hypothetical protein
MSLEKGGYNCIGHKGAGKAHYPYDFLMSRSQLGKVFDNRGFEAPF